MQPKEALAVPVDVTLNANLRLADEISGPSVFGYTSVVNAIASSFTFDSDDLVTLAAGTTINSGTGAGFATDVHVLRASAISNLSPSIGNSSFSVADLQTFVLGATGLSYEVLLFGDLSAISSVWIYLNDGSTGDIRFGNWSCGVSCTIESSGFASDFLTGGFAFVEGVSVQSAFPQGPPGTSVPEPASSALFIMGLLGVAMMRGRRPT
jgi:hypothetical protein